jgi:hypothetical protein
MVKFGGANSLDVAGSPSPRATKWLMPAILLLGTAFRLWNYAGGRPLFHDETSIALDLVYLPLPSLFGELPFDQMAPLGWLLAERAVYFAWPNIDFGLRLLSMIGGVGALFAHWRLSRLTLGAGEALLSVGLFAFAATLISYSAMVKPYIWDALFAAVILGLAVQLLHEKTGRYRTTALLGMTGVACTLFSFGGLTVLAPTGIVLFAYALACRDRRWVVLLTLIGLLWAASLGGLYLLDYRRQTTLTNMVGTYWVGSFAPPPTSVHALAWYYHAPADVLQFLLNGVPALVLMIGVAIGAIVALRRAPWVGVLLAGPFLAALLASALRAYPLDSRLQLALAPPAILLLAYAIGTVAGLTRTPALVFAGLSIPLLSLPAAATARQGLLKPPWATEGTEPNLVRLHREAAPSDVILVTPSAERALLLYGSRIEFRGLRYSVTADHRTGAQCWASGLGALPGRGRAWFLTDHERRMWPSTAAVLANLRQRGSLGVTGTEPDSMLYRIDLARQLPESTVPPVCYGPRQFPRSLCAIAVGEGLRPLSCDARALSGVPGPEIGRRRAGRLYEPVAESAPR